MLLPDPQDEMEEGMNLTREQKGMLGFPVVCTIGVVALIVPIVLAIQSENVAWLLLWIATMPVFGATMVALDKWANKE